MCTSHRSTHTGTAAVAHIYLFQCPFSWTMGKCLGSDTQGCVCVCHWGPRKQNPETKISEKAFDMGGDSFEYWGSEMRKEGC